MDEIRQLPAEGLQESLERIREEEAQRLRLDRAVQGIDAAGGDSAAAARACLEAFLEGIDFERGFLLLVHLEGDAARKDPEAADLRMLASRHRHPAGAPTAWSDVLNPEFAVNRSVVKRAVAGRRLVVVDDCLIQPSPGDVGIRNAETHRAVLCMPFDIAARVAGVLYLDRGMGKGAVTEREQHLVRHAGRPLLTALRATYLAAAYDAALRAGSPSPSSVPASARASAPASASSSASSSASTPASTPSDASPDAPPVDDSDTEAAPEAREIPSFHGIVGEDEKLQKIFKIVEKIRDADLNVCIFGESGTGKELLARAIHEAGKRREHRFVGENCGAIAENLLESELFGYVKGAFTGADEDRKGLFEIADGGTLFLDEIGDMSEGMQRKLLRVLEEGAIRPVGGKSTIRVDSRVICASNRDLRHLVQKGSFRADLFYRLNVITVELPPLRERPGDIPLLVAHAAATVAREDHVRKRFSQSAMKALVQYSWPGNVRELHNVVRKATLTVPGRLIARKDLQGLLRAETASPRSGENVERDDDELILRIPARDSFNEIIDECERVILVNCLNQCAWNKSKVTKALRIPRQSLYNKIAKFSLERDWSTEGPARDPS